MYTECAPVDIHRQLTCGSRLHGDDIAGSLACIDGLNDYNNIRCIQNVLLSISTDDGHLYPDYMEMALQKSGVFSLPQSLAMQQWQLHLAEQVNRPNMGNRQDKWRVFFAPLVGHATAIAPGRAGKPTEHGE